MERPDALAMQTAVLNVHTRFRPPEQRNAELVAETMDTLNQRAKLLSNVLEGRRYLLGESFSVADIAVGHSMVWLKMLELLEPYPILDSYLERLQQREAFQAVYGPQVQVFPDPHA